MKGLCPYQIYSNIKRRYTQSIFSGKQKKGNTMDEKKIEKLYELMERAKKNMM